MNVRDIEIGKTLTLKRDRQAAYGMSQPFVRVDEIRSKKGYKTPWIVQRLVTHLEFYKPSDFIGR